MKDLSIQGAMISLKHSPRMQSEVQVVMRAPGAEGAQEMILRGYVVRIEEGAEKGTTAVGVPQSPPINWACVLSPLNATLTLSLL